MAERDAEQIQRDIERARAESNAGQIQREIEQARTSLANSVDQIVSRTSPKHIIDTAKTSLLQKAQTPKGKAIIAGAGALVAIVIIRRVRNRRDER